MYVKSCFSLLFSLFLSPSRSLSPPPPLSLSLSSSPSLSLTHSLRQCTHIPQMMETRGMLKSHEGWNLLFKAVSRLGNVGALITSYNDMQEQGIHPNLSTYHLVIDSLLATRNRKTITGIVFPLWRMIVQDYPRVQPDVDLINKFIRSCRLSQYYERAFFFLTSMKDCNVAPNLETFKELFDVREQ